MILASATFVLLPVAAAQAQKVYVPNSEDANVSVIDGASNSVVGSPIGVEDEPRGVVFLPNATRAYVANGDSDTVSVIDVASDTVIDTANVGDEPRGIAVTPDGSRVYVVNVEDDTVSVIDTSDNSVGATPISVGDDPRGVAIAPNGARAYVTNAGDDTVSVIDTASNTEIDTAAVGNTPRGVAVSPNSTRVFVADSDDGTVSVIDASDNSVDPTPIAVGDEPRGIAFTPNGSRAYVTVADTSFPEDEDRVSVIDTSTDGIVTAIGLPDDSRPDGIAITSDAARAYTANTDTDNVSVIDIASNTVAGSPITVGDKPRALALTPSQSQGTSETPAQPGPEACASDSTRPRLRITSDQRRTLYRVGQRASVTIRASDASGLRADPSRRGRRISTRTAGRKRFSRTAVDNCGNRRRRTFRYIVARRPRVGVAGVSAVGCESSRFSVNVRVGTSVSLRRVRVLLDGRRIAQSRRRSFRVRVPAGRLAAGRHRLTVIATDAAGNTTRRTARFSRCQVVVPHFTG